MMTLKRYKANELFDKLVHKSDFELEQAAMEMLRESKYLLAEIICEFLKIRQAGDPEFQRKQL